MTSKKRALGWLAAIVLIVAGGLCFTLYQLADGRPRPGSAEYEAYTRAFQVGLAALDSDLLPQAEENLTQCTKLMPSEPAAWANLGLLYLRSGQLDQSNECLMRAKSLSPESTSIAKLLAHLRQREGAFDEAAQILKKIVERKPGDVRSLYQLIQVVDQQSQPGAEDEQLALLERLLSIEPKNIRLLVDRLRLAIRTGREPELKTTLTQIESLTGTWHERTVKAWSEFKQAIEKDPQNSNPPSLLRFTNTLLAESAFVRDSSRLETPEAFVGEAVEEYLWLKTLERVAASADRQLKFTQQPLTRRASSPVKFVVPFWPTVSAQVEVIEVSDSSLRLLDTEVAFDAKKSPTSSSGLLAVDIDNDLHTDLVIADQGGLLLLRNKIGKGFEDDTTATGLDASIVDRAYSGGCIVDFDMDGDLDVMLYPRDSAPLVVRNNFDATFTAVSPFDLASTITSAVWGDYDNDGAIDVAMLDTENQLHVFANQRSGKFSPWQAKFPAEKWMSVVALDATNDGQIDIVGVTLDGRLLALSDVDKQASWQSTELCRAAPRVAAIADKSSVTLFDADFDNNGTQDVWLSSPSTSQLWLGEPNGSMVAVDVDLASRASGVADMDQDGRIDVLATTAAGEPVYGKNSGQASYQWLDVYPQAARGKTDGDNRINSFGINGIIELRAGSFVSTQIIHRPTVHFGLGNHSRAEVLRILWPNGTFQYEFTPAAQAKVVAIQRLKGSCPFLFAWNGSQFEFVTDFMWSTPLGMFINASDKGGFLQTTDWVKIPGPSLVAKDGVLELRVNANLWETHYFDHISLKAFDHPADAHFVIDERFFLEPSTPQPHWFNPPRMVSRVVDQSGRDVRNLLAHIDGQHVDVGERGRYQGLTAEHWLEFDVEESAGQRQSLLVRGWIHPTDSSVNYALAQGQHAVPHGLILEVRGANDEWVVLHDRLGFPAGKNKTIVVPLPASHRDDPTASSNVQTYRLRTNLEIYWDWIGLAEPLEAVDFREHEVNLTKADLRSRGIVEMVQASASAPELPVYQRLIARGQYWRDLVGYHTRPGDIRELIAAVDDRYAILTAGDEVITQFDELPPVPTGWVRDYVWVSDGWVKDGDLNTRYGKTVLPLPSHHMSAYMGDPNSLEQDPVYQRFPDDWERFHTRYIDTHAFDRGLRRCLPNSSEGQSR